MRRVFLLVRMLVRVLVLVLVTLLVRAATATPEPGPGPVHGPTFDGPLTPAEIADMMRDGPGIVRLIAAQNLMIVNGTTITKSFMDAVMPEIHAALHRIDTLQQQLPEGMVGPVNTEAVLKQFDLQWRDANASHANASVAMQIKYLVEQVRFETFPDTVRNMTLREQANMRAMFTTARDRIAQVVKFPSHHKYIEATDQSVSILYNTLRELLGAEKDLRFLLVHERTRREAIRLMNVRMEEVKATYQQSGKRVSQRDR